MKRTLATLAIALALDACSAGQEGVSRLRDVDSTLLWGGRRLRLDVFANRDYMPMTPPTGFFYMIVHVTDGSSDALPTPLHADSVWITDRSSGWTARRWTTRLTPDSDARDGLTYRASPNEGPAAGSTIDVVARLLDAGGQAHLLARRGVRVSLTD